MGRRGSGESLSLGEILRRARKSKRVSLEQLASGTELSVSFLSQLECGKANVSVENLKKITKFLDIHIASLFGEEKNSSLGTVIRKGEGMPFTLEGSTAYCEALIRKSGANLQATFYKSPPGEGRKVPFGHVGEELLYVVSGEVLFRLNDEEYHLYEGDLIHHRSEALHSWINPGKKDCVVLVVNTPPSW
ncbi:MAG: helix-turn-helix domain-containing protein [Desulfobacteraceae bacterium]